MILVTVVITALGPVSDPCCSTHQKSPKQQKQAQLSVLFHEIFKCLLGKKV